MDVNDNDPQLSQYYYNITLLENEQVGTILTDLVGSDADTNEHLTYHITGGNDLGEGGGTNLLCSLHVHVEDKTLSYTYI